MAAITLKRALALALARSNAPAFLDYDLSLELWRLYRSKSLEGQLLRIKNSVPSRQDYVRVVNELLNSAVLTRYDFDTPSAYTLLGRKNAPAPEVACSLDPFCYLSHLSAMEFHGLTDRMPEQLYVSSPARPAWSKFAAERMQKDFGDDWAAYRSSGLPMLRKATTGRIQGRPTNWHPADHLGAFLKVADMMLRVATTGRTFLDMLRNPELCGGIYHVLERFKQHAEANLRAIISELDQHGGPIDKVRAGYILEERCGLHHPAFESWVQFASRGGSRKLDAQAAYAPRFSERWSLSINIEEAAQE